jgi:hypothetical protein
MGTYRYLRVSRPILVSAVPAASRPDCRHPATGTRDREARFAVRFREDDPEDLARARAEVAAWRAGHPAGTGEELMAALGHRYHRDYAPVLRAVLFAADRHRSHEITASGRR